MSEDSRNPFAALQEVDQSAVTEAIGISWRLIPTIVFLVLGSIGVAIGVAMFANGIQVMAELASDPELMELFLADSEVVRLMLLSPILHLACGLLLLTAGWTSWRQKWKYAVPAAGGGVAFFYFALKLPSPSSSLCE